MKEFIILETTSDVDIICLMREKQHETSKKYLKKIIFLYVLKEFFTILSKENQQCFNSYNLKKYIFVKSNYILFLWIGI